jgi:hypothetical protein
LREGVNTNQPAVINFVVLERLSCVREKDRETYLLSEKGGCGGRGEREKGSGERAENDAITHHQYT